MRRTVSALGLVAFGLVLAAAILEVSIRAFNLFPHTRAAARVMQDSAALPNQKLKGSLIHPFLGWSLAPGSDTSVGQPVNSFGFYSAIWDYRAPQDGAFVIGIFGGSAAHAVVVLAGKTIKKRVAADLMLPKEKIVILNFSMGAYKQPQQAIGLMLAIMLGVHLDVVVNLDGFNEVALGGSDAAGGFHPIFPSRYPYGSVVDLLGSAISEETMETSAEIIRARRSARRLVAMLDRYCLRSSATAEVVFGALAKRQLYKAAALEPLLVSQAASKSVIPSLSDPCLSSQNGCWEQIADIWEHGSRLMDAMARQAGAKYVHLLQPNQYVENSKPLSDEEKAQAYDPTNAWSQQIVAGYRFLQQRGPRLQASGIAFHDLTNVFTDRTETLYADVCCHVNKAGNRILGRAVAAHVAALFRGGKR